MNGVSRIGSITAFLGLVLSLLIACSGHQGKPEFDLSNKHGFYFSANFEELSEGARPEYWMEPMGQNHWTVAEQNGNQVLEQPEVRPTASLVYLHMFDRNPYFEGRFRLDQINPESRFSVLIRYNHPSAFLKFLVDPENNVVKLLEQEDAGRPQRVISSIPVNIRAKQWYDFRIAADTAQLTFYLDEQVVVKGAVVKHCTFGRIGFETTAVAAAVDDIEYYGVEGRPNPGVVEGEIKIRLDTTTFNTHGLPLWGLHMGIYEQNPDELVGIVGFRESSYTDKGDNYRHPFAVIRSNDQGITWNNLELHQREYLKDSEGKFIRGIWPNLIKNGNRLMMIGYPASDSDSSWSYTSADNGQNWTRNGSFTITPELEHLKAGSPWQLYATTMPGKLTLTTAGSIFYPTTRVLWRTDDFGNNWNPVYIFYPECTEWKCDTQEHSILEIEGSNLKLYGRDERPGSLTLAQSISNDNGETWGEFEMNQSPFISSKCAFNAKRDPFDQDTYWVFWTFNNKEDEPQVNNTPRTRLGLAVSYDGMKTWQYAMDVDDWGYPSYDTTYIDPVKVFFSRYGLIATSLII